MNDFIRIRAETLTKEAYPKVCKWIWEQMLDNSENFRQKRGFVINISYIMRK